MSFLVVGQRFNPYWRFRRVSVIPNELMGYPDLSPSAKLLWARLAQYAGKDGKAYPSIAALADDLNLKERQVQNLLADLKKKGFIESRKGPRNNSYYFLLHSCLIKGIKQNIALEDAKKCLSDTQEIAPKETKKKNQRKETTKKNVGRRPSFSDLSKKEQRYIELKTECEVVKGNIHTSPEAYKAGLVKIAQRGELETSGLEALESWKRGEQAAPGLASVPPEFVIQVRSYLEAETRTPKEICRLIRQQEKSGAGEKFWGLPLREVALAMQTIHPEFFGLNIR